MTNTLQDNKFMFGSKEITCQYCKKTLPSKFCKRHSPRTSITHRVYSATPTPQLADVGGLDSPFLLQFRELKKKRNNHVIDEPEFDEAVEQLAADLYAHNTIDGYCCACDADMAFMKAEIKEATERATKEERDRWTEASLKRIAKYDQSGVPPDVQALIERAEVGGAIKRFQNLNFDLIGMRDPEMIKRMVTSHLARAHGDLRTLTTLEGDSKS